MRMESQKESQDTQGLFAQFLNISNAALDRHRDESPYKQIIETGNKLLRDRRIGVAVYADEPSEPHDYYTVEWKNGKLLYWEHGKDEPDVELKVKNDYLRQVVENAEEYLNKPYLLDWDWLKSRLGLG